MSRLDRLQARASIDSRESRESRESRDSYRSDDPIVVGTARHSRILSVDSSSSDEDDATIADPTAVGQKGKRRRAQHCHRRACCMLQSCVVLGAVLVAAGLVSAASGGSPSPPPSKVQDRVRDKLPNGSITTSTPLPPPPPSSPPPPATLLLPSSQRPVALPPPPPPPQPSSPPVDLTTITKAVRTGAQMSTVYSASLDAFRAIDGKLSTFCATATGGGGKARPWLSVRVLASTPAIGYVAVHNRQDIFAERLGKFEVWVGGRGYGDTMSQDAFRCGTARFRPEHEPVGAEARTLRLSDADSLPPHATTLPHHARVWPQRPTHMVRMHHIHPQAPYVFFCGKRAQYVTLRQIDGGADPVLSVAEVQPYIGIATPRSPSPPPSPPLPPPLPPGSPPAASFAPPWQGVLQSSASPPRPSQHRPLPAAQSPPPSPLWPPASMPHLAVAREVAVRLNARFASGQPSGSAEAAGVFLAHWSSKFQPARPVWVSCATATRRTPSRACLWLAPHMPTMELDGRFAATVVNAMVPQTEDPDLCGIALSPDAIGRRCALAPQQADDAALIPAGYQAPVGSTGQTAPCPDVVASVRRRSACPRPPITYNERSQRDGHCAWRRQPLRDAMEQQRGLCSPLEGTPRAASDTCYNLLVLDFSRLSSRLPTTVEALFVQPTSSAKECRRAYELRDQLQSEFGSLGYQAPPVLLYDSSWRSRAASEANDGPFSPAASC